MSAGMERRNRLVPTLGRLAMKRVTMSPDIGVVSEW
jgi:hypothetical protein